VHPVPSSSSGGAPVVVETRSAFSGYSKEREQRAGSVGGRETDAIRGGRGGEPCRLW